MSLKVIFRNNNGNARAWLPRNSILISLRLQSFICPRHAAYLMGTLEVPASPRNQKTGPLKVTHNFQICPVRFAPFRHQEQRPQ